MKRIKFLLVLLGAASLALSSRLVRAADMVNMVAAGSSAQFTTFTKGFLYQGYSSHYSLSSSSSFQIADPGTPNQNTQVAIYWKGSAGSYQVAVFYQVDSTIGVRAFFNSDTVTAPASISLEPAGSARKNNLGQPGSGDVAPPAEVLSTINGATVDTGVTDITPEDARVATERTINLGYNAANPIQSATNTASMAIPVRFSLSARAFTLTPIGATPILVFVNNGPSFSGLAGANLNINSFTLAGLLSGQLTRTSDLLLAPGAVPVPVHTYIGEPLSGTYNAMEYTCVESLSRLGLTNGRQSGNTSANGGQELNVSATGNNPLNEPATGSYGPDNSGRIRVIGDVERINAVANDPTDAIGYAFWSVGSFRNQTTVRYLTVDGVEPLLDNYAGGSLANIGPFNTPPTFRNITNGGYPLWNILRAVTPQNPTTALSAIISSVQGADSLTDFYSSFYLRVFRSYHLTPFTPGGANGVSNGNNGTPGGGGDVGGAVFTTNNDLNAYNDFGNDLTNRRQ